MKKTLILASLAVVLYGVPLADAQAQEAKPAAQPAAQPAAKPAAQPDAMTDKEKAEYTKKVDAFVQVASYAEENKDPLVLLTAVKMLDNIPFGGIVKPGQDEKTGAKYDRDALLAEAKKFATGDTELLAVIQKVQDAPEPTATRWRDQGQGHRPPPPPGYGPRGYYERPYHERRYPCRWYRECRHGRCEWICGR